MSQLRKVFKINPSEAQFYVRDRDEFIAGSMFSCNRTYGSLVDGNTLYIVYSYGEHFPMYIFDHQTREWYGNSDKFSKTTSKHKNQADPGNVSKWFDTDMMKAIVNCGGLARVVERRITDKKAA